MWCAVVSCTILNSATVTVLLFHCSRGRRETDKDDDDEKIKQKKRVEPSIRIKVDPIPLDEEDAEELKTSSKSKKSDTEHEWEKQLKKVEDQLQQTLDRKSSEGNPAIICAKDVSKTAKLPLSALTTNVNPQNAASKEQLNENQDRKKEGTSGELHLRVSQRDNMKAPTAIKESQQSKALSKTNKSTALQSPMSKRKEAAVMAKMTGLICVGEKLKSKRAAPSTIQTAKECNNQKTKFSTWHTAKIDRKEKSVNEERLGAARERLETSNLPTARHVDKFGASTKSKAQGNELEKIHISGSPSNRKTLTLKNRNKSETSAEDKGGGKECKKISQAQLNSKKSTPKESTKLKTIGKNKGQENLPENKLPSQAVLSREMSTTKKTKSIRSHSRKKQQAGKQEQRIASSSKRKLVDDDGNGNSDAAAALKSGTVPTIGMSPVTQSNKSTTVKKRLEIKTAPTPPSAPSPLPRSKRLSKLSPQRLKMKSLRVRIKHATPDGTTTEGNTSSGKTIPDEKTTASVQEAQRGNNFLARFFK
ncbi:hypothetical protein Tcan_04175 [Toxocara canis]|uniref:Uncharacterized protein n=1 Tax=Toxocara canis TaxID=6265 RepID=A0A0B2VNV6_TOXCA|nr:hypothetical protein Tcan_04175 [Toxocara canis]